MHRPSLGNTVNYSRPWQTHTCTQKIHIVAYCISIYRIGLSIFVSRYVFPSSVHPFYVCMELHRVQCIPAIRSITVQVGRKGPLCLYAARGAVRSLKSCLVVSKQWPRRDNGADSDGMPLLSAGVIPEHTAVGAHQAAGQRRAFLPFGQWVSGAGTTADTGLAPCFRGAARSDRPAARYRHCCSTSRERVVLTQGSLGEEEVEVVGWW